MCIIYLIDKVITLVVCPGLADCSERGYIRAFAAHATAKGYRLAILNLLGSLENEELKTPRIFDFGMCVLPFIHDGMNTIIP